MAYTLAVEAQPIPPEPALTVREQKFAEAVVMHNGNKAAAAREIGVSAVSANATGSRLAAIPAVKSEIQRLAEEVGLSAKKCLETVAEGLDAKRGVVVGGKFASRIEYVDDWQAKTMCAELGLKVHKAIDAPGSATMNLNVIGTGDWDQFAADYFARKNAINAEKA